MSKGGYPVFPGWVDREKLYVWLAGRGVTEVRVLPRDNQTDGEVHRLFRHVSGSEFEFRGSWYAAESWRPLTSWAMAVSAEAGV